MKTIERIENIKNIMDIIKNNKKEGEQLLEIHNYINGKKLK